MTTHPLPRTVLTVSKRDFGLLRQSPRRDDVGLEANEREDEENYMSDRQLYKPWATRAKALL